MLILLPLIALLLLLSIFHTRSAGLRPAFVSAAVTWGVILFGITEVLSWADLFLRGGIATAWLIVDLALAAWLWRITNGFSQQWRSGIASQWRDRPQQPDDIPYGLLAGCAVLVAGSGVIALICPPNTPDVLFYHMARVVYWLDHGNVAYYSNVYLPQLYMPPWAEYAMAHLFALAAGDRFVNLVQWFSLGGCAIGVSWLAKLLNASPRGQVLAAAVSVAIPQGLLQSSGAGNDYVAAFWLVCCVCLLIAFQQRPDAGSAILAGLSAGLALLTKGTSYIFLPPIALLLFLTWNRTIQIRFLRLSPLVILAALLLNVHHFARNYDLCHGLASCPTALGAGDLYRFSNDRITIPVVASNAIRNVSLHIGMPSEALNKTLTDWAERAIGLFGIDASDPGSTWTGVKFRVAAPMTHEDGMGDPFHLLLICVVIGILLFDKSSRQRDVLACAGGLLLAGILFCAALRWQPWHMRLHLPLFVLWSAVIGVVLGRKLRLAAVASIGTVLLMLAMPVLLENRMRPVIDAGGIFATTRESLYHAPASYRAVADLADRISCKSIGIDSAAVGLPEYALLVDLHAGLGVRDIRQLRIPNVSSKYTNPASPFKPSCVVCVNCPRNSERWKSYESAGLRGLVVQDMSLFYTGNGVSPGETYRIALRFPAVMTAGPLPDPLLTIGRFGEADFFYVRYLGGNSVAFGFHHWGVGGPESAPVAIVPGRDYTADVLLNSAAGTVEVLLDGQSLLNLVSPIYPHQASEVFIGRNPIGGAAAGPAFSGQATPAK